MAILQEKGRGFSIGDPFDFDTEYQKADRSHWGQTGAEEREEQKALKTERTERSSTHFKGGLANWGIEVSFKERRVHIYKQFREKPLTAGTREQAV